MRKKTRVIKVGDRLIGGNNPITVQSMTNTKTSDVESTAKQILSLEEVGCDIIRCAVTSSEDAKAIEKIKSKISIPMIADIQFDYRLALESIKYGIDGLRINPGNIGSFDKVKEVVEACKERNLSIRIGVNSGSVKKEFLEKFGGVNEESLVYSALEQVKLLEELDFYDIKISLKASDVKLTIDSYKKMSEMVDYPLHLGVTEAGTPFKGTIKSAVGIGTLLAMGVGDTLRVSLTTNDLDEEVKVGKEILKSLGLIDSGIEFISCPTCARTDIDLIEIANKVELALENRQDNIKVAIMGCAVNGPGEAREADIGIAGGNKEAIIFSKGKIIKKVKEEEVVDELLKEIDKLKQN